MLAIWSLVPLPFLNPVCTSGSSWFTYCWSPAWRILSTTLLVCEISAIVQQFEPSLAFPFFEIGMKTDLFQSCGHCWVLQICWHNKYSTLTASSFRIFNSSAGIPSPPLALFIIMLPTAQIWTKNGNKKIIALTFRSSRSPHHIPAAWSRQINCVTPKSTDEISSRYKILVH